MAKKFDFNKIERRYFPVGLKDGTDLLVKMPEKRVWEKLNALGGVDNGGIMDALNEMCAEILSNNVSGKEISPAYVQENLDFEEKLCFINAYRDFILSLESDPN